MKRIFSAVMLLLVSMLMSATVYRGNFSDFVSYVLDTETGLMRISGTGANLKINPKDENMVELVPYIKTITVAKGVTSCAPWGFAELPELTKITLPSDFKLNDYAFYGCPKLETVTGCKIQYRKYLFYKCSSLKNVSHPTSVTYPTTLPEFCFYGCSSLESVVLPEGIGEIGELALGACSSLNKLVLPESLGKIRWRAFEKCTSLKEVVMPSSVSIWESCLFKDCTSLESVEINNHPSNGEIPDSCFLNCTSLKSVVIPSTIQNVWKASFANCTSLESVNFEGNVNILRDYAFYNCPRLRAVGFNGNTPEAVGYLGFDIYTDSDGILFLSPEANQREALGYFAYWQKVVAPWEISGQAGDACYYDFHFPKMRIYGNGNMYDNFSANTDVSSIMPGIVELVVEDGITGIGKNAFVDCGHLRKMELQSSTTTVHPQAMVRTSTTGVLTVPEGSKGHYAVLKETLGRGWIFGGASPVYDEEPEKDAEGYYLISGVLDLLWARDTFEKLTDRIKIRLTADIDLSPICNETQGGWTPIGVDSDSPFTGTFDGQGHTIKGLYLDDASGLSCGFFGNIKDAEIKNVKFDGTTIASNSTGAVCVASARGNSHIADIEVMGDITAKNTFGVIAQTVYDNTILERCVNRAHFTNTTDSNCSFAGIVLGMLNSSIVRDCMYLGSAKMQNTVGMAGLALSLGGDSRLENCLSAGSLEADSSPIPFEYAADQIFGLIHFGQGSVLRCFADVRSNVVFNGHKLTQDELSLSYNTAEPIPGELGGSESFASASDLASGKVAFLLQNGREETVWGQTIGKDEMPVLGGAPVYGAPYLNCQGVPAEELGYKLSNEGVPATEKYHGDGHFFGEDGFCKYCHTLMAPEIDEQGRTLIANLGNLLWFRDYVKNHSADIQAQGGYDVLQTADIDLSSVCHPASETQPAANWKPILNPGVYGTYDGGGHTITGLYINDPAGADAPYASFFGYIGYNGAYYADGKITRIKNLTIEGDITSGIDCAIFGGAGALAFFENCTSRGTINYNAITTQSNVAGILGKGKNCTFTDCHNKASITAVSQQTGNNFYAGVAIQGIFERCTNTGDITITAGYAGGITCSTVSGNPDGTAAEFCIKNCSNTGNITAICDMERGLGHAAAITGRLTSETPIVNCWYSCNVIQDATAIPAQNKIILGTLYGPKSKTELTPVVTNCYYNTTNKQVATSDVAKGYTNPHFSNGHVAALLGEPWGQNIDMDPSSPKDSYPVLGSYPVYMITSLKFSNFSPSDLNKDGHISIADLTKKVDADKKAGIKPVTNELRTIIDLILEK